MWEGDPQYGRGAPVCGRVLPSVKGCAPVWESVLQC